MDNNNWAHKLARRHGFRADVWLDFDSVLQTFVRKGYILYKYAESDDRRRPLVITYAKLYRPTENDVKKALDDALEHDAEELSRDLLPRMYGL